MNKLFIATLSLVFTSVFSQQKQQFNGAEYLLKSIVTNDNNIGSWKLIYHRDGVDHSIKTVGIDIGYLPQNDGFKLDDYDNGFYYIVYGNAENPLYIKTLPDLKRFLGTMDNGEEAAIQGVIKGYVIDEEFENLAANFHPVGNYYMVELGKVTSEKCPYQKKFYQLSVDKNTGEIVSEKEKGVYFEVFDKTCENNPHYDALKEQVNEAAAAAEKKRLENKEIVKKQKQMMLRRMRRN